MSDNCFKKNDLQITGTRVNERLSKALSPAYVLPDERSFADLLVFISNYARLINYYALKGSEQQQYILDGNWEPLIKSDESFNYAGISVTPSSLPNITFYKHVNLYETQSTDSKRRAAYRVLWDILFSLYKEINSFYASMPVHMPLRSEMAAELNNGLKTDFSLAAGAYLNSEVAFPSAFKLQVSTSSADDEYKFEYADDIIKGGFDKIWIVASNPPLEKSWNEYLLIIRSDLSFAEQFFNTSSFASERDRIDYSTLQLKQIFKRAFEAYARIITKANVYLQNSLEKNSSHFAHHGLMLSFLKLFGVLQTDMNDFTRKHIEYYYSRVLKINPAPALPDAVHVVFEPAKNVDTHLIEKNTALNGGKDATGKILLYNSDEEIVINKSKVEQLKTVFLKPYSSAEKDSKVYASPVANSSDGNGSPFTGEDKSWKGFGDVHKDAVTGNETNTADPGFYIASPVLHLTEGARFIKFIFITDEPGIKKIKDLSKPDRIKLFTFSFSGEKQWEPLIFEDTDSTDFNSQLVDFYQNEDIDHHLYFAIEIILLPQCKPIVGYDASICSGNLNTVYPVIKFALNQNLAPDAYESLRDIVISKITINTYVNEITGLSIQNDLGAVDASKPVQPFGPNPKKNSAFYIGHPELEHKLITLISIYPQWLDLNPDLKSYYSYKFPKQINGTTEYTPESYVPGVESNSSFKVKTDFIRNKEWIPNTAPEVSLFETSVGLGFVDVKGNSTLKPALAKPSSYTKGTIPYTTSTQNGFIRLTLSAPADAFGHTLWPKIFAQQTVALTKDADITHNTLPNPPYTPLLQSVKLFYAATQDIDFDAHKPDQGQLFHIMPFGIKEINKEVTLLPKFELQVKKKDNTLEYKDMESALYIGVSNAVLNQNISLLIQVSEGSENISVNTPEVNWNYLSVEGWKNLDKKLLTDSTSGLIKSGIVKFQVPIDINIESTEFPSGYLWLMAAIEPGMDPSETASEGLPRLLAVNTNAVKATFADNGNDPEHLTAALPAGSISKLYISDAAIKQVNQPFPSFGGKKIEEGNIFYNRASERLRHKHRAITIWDYERLVLNEFKEVYMVKCLNHTGYKKDCKTPPEKGIYKENLPGSVLLVPVPYITNLQTGNKFQPALSTAKLDAIKNFLTGVDNNISCNSYLKAIRCQLASLFVENPLYETIEVTCTIKVGQCFDKFFYKAQLAEDLNTFLSPWITGDPGKINFGGKLHISQVIYFIEQLEYIDYIINVTLKHRLGNIELNIIDPSVAVATTSKSVLTSSGLHFIELA
jgi:hypothetical protein